MQEPAAYAEFPGRERRRELLRRCRIRSSKCGEALMLLGLALGLYAMTLSPTVLWGDEGHLQLQAVQGTLQGSAGSHPLWVFIAHLFTQIPIGDVAGRVNFVSALFGCVTVSLLYLFMREIRLGKWAAVMAAVALMFSHTFWSYSVRAEVYTLTLAAMLLLAFLGLRWYHTGRLVYLAGTGRVLGLGLSVHLMVILFVPALLWLFWMERERIDAKAFILLTSAVLVGVLPLIALILRDTKLLNMDWKQAISWALFSFEGYSFRDAMFDFSLRYFLSDLFQWFAFLGLQFVGLALVAGVVGAFKSRQVLGKTEALYVLILYVFAVGFSFSYRVGDRYVFYLPSYLPFAIWIACGFQWVEQRWPVRRGSSLKTQLWPRMVLMGVLVGIPVATYRIGPELTSRGLTFRESWHVPGEGGEYFFLWPPKRGYYAPRVYAEEVFDVLPEGAKLLAEPILASPLQFMQIVEGRRPDIAIEYCCWNIREVLEGAGNRPVAVTELRVDSHTTDWIRRNYDLIRRGPIYLLVPLSDSQS